MRRLLHSLYFLLALFLGCGQLVSQEATRTLYVINAETSAPVADVICSLWDSAHRRTAFYQSDHTGMVKLRLIGGEQSISFALLGFAKLELSLSGLQGEKPIIRLQPQTTRLREVHVKAPPITVHNDTLRYRVKAFAGRGDRYLEDVLKKLPGVKVHEDGCIEYQGLSINKFYIEGMDPLGMNYKQASRNIPTDAVDQVDVIQHNQHKRVLQGKVFEEHPALNIRLNSKYRFRPFGEVTAGAGLPLGQGQGKVFLMQAGRSNQLITRVKANNIGADLLSDFTEPVDLLQTATYISPPSLFLSPALGAQSPPLPTKRFLLNKALIWSANDLQRLSEYATLRLHVKGYHDRVQRESDQQTEYLGAQPFVLSEHSSLKTQPNHYRLGLHYELNAPKSFLQAELTAGFQRESYRESLTAGGQGYELALTQSPRWVQTNLQGDIHLGNHLVSLYATGQLYTAPEHLSGSISLGMPLDESRKITQLMTRSKASINVLLHKVTLRTSLLADLEERRFDQPLHRLTPARYRKLELGPDLSLSWGREPFSISLSSPIQLRLEHLSLGGYSQTKQVLQLAPTLSLRQQFGPRSRLAIYGGYSSSPDTDPYYLSSGATRRSYRLYYASLQRLSDQRRWHIASRFTFHDPARIFFTHVDLRYSESTYDHYRDLSYTEEASWSIPIDSLHHRQSYSAQLTLDKSIAPLGLVLRGVFGYTRQHYLTSLHQHSYPTCSHALISQVFLGWNKFRWLELSYEGSISRSQYELEHQSPPALWVLGEELKAGYTPSKELQFTCSLEHTMNPTQRHYQHSFFCDLGVVWSPKPHLRLALSLSNLTDERAYTVTSLSSSERIRYSLPLRSRELLLSCSFRL